MPCYILAGVCHHVIDTTHTIDWSEKVYAVEVSCCDLCAARLAEQQQESAKPASIAQCSDDKMDCDGNDVMDCESAEADIDPEQTKESILNTLSTRPTIVRFAEPESHRPESQYRKRHRYYRRDSGYSPGFYADRSGHGYLNTSDPVDDSEDDDKDMDDEEEESEDEHDPLDDLSDEELRAKRLRLEEALKRYQSSAPQGN